jgi:hypothetical protein
MEAHLSVADKVVQRPASELYEKDFYAWANEQARLLKQIGPLKGLDTKNLIEEIEDMGRSEAAALRSALGQALVHLVKLAYSPVVNPHEKWKSSVVKQRVKIEALLEDSPSLISKMELIFAKAWKDARKIAVAELADYNESPEIPAICPFTVGNVRDESYFPQAPGQGAKP